jgi:uncharacterized protein
VSDARPSGDDPKVTFYWDFFGPNATGTATHFEKHLQEFLRKNAVAGCSTGTESAGEGHLAAYCVTPAAAVELVERALKPKRRQ